MGKIVKSQCTCGEIYYIELDAKTNFRADKKRIFRDGDDSTLCVFRCRKCKQIVSESVQGAEHEAVVEQ